jgi:predicted lipoprotein
MTTATDKSTITTTEIYQLVHHALDTHCPDTMAQRLSDIYTALAVLHHNNTGERIGVTLGWSKAL